MKIVDNEGPICPVCNFRVFKLTECNGQKMCVKCKRAIQKNKQIRKFEGRRE